jgi:CBS-domain-containing membrane protein
MAIFAGTNGALSIAIMAFIDRMTSAPFIFPSLGPSAFLFFSRPLARAAAPRNAVLGHLIGGVCGLWSLALFGLLGKRSILITGVDTHRILAAALSVALTSALLVYLRVEHPPALATTLILSLGFMRSVPDFAVLMLAVGLITVQAVAINRRAGFPFPLWKPRPETERREREADSS